VARQRCHSVLNVRAAPAVGSGGHTSM
jgi:hypothetical protein